jgi:hypothetical protein
MSLDVDCNTTGLFHGVEWERYRTIQRVNVSNLKEMGRSAKHYRYRCEHEKKTATLALGKAAHCAVLEPKRFERDFVVWDERTDTGRLRPRNSKDYAAFELAHAGKAVLTPDEHRYALDVRTAIRDSKTARKYLRDGEPEVTMLWDDAATGRPCKGRADWITTVDSVDAMVGLKTSRDLDPRKFSAQAAALHYYLQWAFYYDGYSVITGKEPRVVEICLEAEPPYDVVVYVIPSDVLELGREEYRSLLGKVGECESAQRWPGRADNEVVFELPAYLQPNEENLEGLELEGETRKRAVDALNEGL